MYENILVPLDGSELAETALFEAVKVAKLAHAENLILLSVVQIPSVLFAEGMDGNDIVRFQQVQYNKAQKYLTDVESRLSAEGIHVKSVIVEGSAAESIVTYSLTHTVDLIVIATHGYTGMKKLMLGSVALSVLHDSHVPVLLIRPATSRK